MIPEGWRKSTLKSLVQTDRKISYGIVQPGDYTEGGIPLIRGKDYSRGWADLSEVFRVSEEIDRPYRRSKVVAGDILLTIVGEYTGNTAIVPPQFSGANITQTTARIAVDEKKADPKFVYFSLSGLPGRREVYRFKKGGAQPGLNISDVEKFSLPLPSRYEQEKISQILSTWDHAIDVTGRLIENSQDKKRALVQQLLSGSVRLAGFSKPWRQTRLAQIGAFRKGRGIRRDDLVSQGLPCVLYGDIYTRHNDFIREFFSYITPDVARTSERISKGDLLFACSGETVIEIGKCTAFVDDFEAYAGGDIVILSVKRGDPKFLGYLMNSTSVVEQKAKFGQGHSVVHISAANLGRISVSLPDLEEQKAIASILEDVDNEISNLSRQLNCLKTERNALMQQLLTGKRRVRPSEVTNG